MNFDKRELRILDETRKTICLQDPLFEAKSLSSLILEARAVISSYKKAFGTELEENSLVSCALLHTAYQSVLSVYLLSHPSFFENTESSLKALATFFDKAFPKINNIENSQNEDSRGYFIYQVIKANPIMLEKLDNLVSSENLIWPKDEKEVSKSFLDSEIFEILTKPSRLFPHSLSQQLAFITEHWEQYLEGSLLELLEKASGFLLESYCPTFYEPQKIETYEPDFSTYDFEYESFSDDKNWMPNVVMMAKNTLVWLDQLSKKYNRRIIHLSQIPDEELDLLQSRGFNALWLIGLWERSQASKKIKNLCGNQEAEASAYSLKNYNIAALIGGWEALGNLKYRCSLRGIRLASDMVPNHTGLDSDWMKEHPEYFIKQDFAPFPSYTFTGPNLSDDPRFEIKIEDHYYNKTDAAVVFRRIDHQSGETSYVFHGNDGTTMPWNDTAQLNFLNTETREAVIRQIIEVAKNFPIIRFDAAMTLARKHIHRLWYPTPGTKADIAGRALYALSDQDFLKALPQEFFREVVDRIAIEAPDTLLLAEAFWMMEGFFVRTLGMHRVYNSAFMNMLKREENQKYRDTIKKTIEFDPEILKRYVNFMNNPDEESAITQFGNGDKYFGVCTLLSTMPGLPMFGHGQIEGFSEKYGMEFTHAYWDEKEDLNLIEAHQKKIFPLLKLRYLFSGCDFFEIFDVSNQDSIFAYVNGVQDRRALVLYNNQYQSAGGFIKQSCPKLVRKNCSRNLQTTSILNALNIQPKDNCYLIARLFSTNKCCLINLQKASEQGIQIQLNGYETRVFVDLKVLEDTSGHLKALHEKYGDFGLIEDFDKEYSKIILKPFFSAVASLFASKFTNLLKKSITTSSSIAEKRLFCFLEPFYQQLASCDKEFASLGLKLNDFDQQKMKVKLHKLVSNASKPFYKIGLQILGPVCEILSAYLITSFFVSNEPSVSEVLNVSNKLMLDHALGIDKEFANLGSLLNIANADVEHLLKDQSFRALIGTNVYNNITWYKQEAFQNACFIVLMSKSLNNHGFKMKIIEQEYVYWLEKINNSKYILDNLCLKG